MRNAKAHFGIDLASTDTGSYATRMSFDGLAFVEVVYALYKRQLDDHFPTKTAFEDAVSSDEEFDEARKEVVGAISGFFPLPRMVFMKMQENLIIDQKAEDQPDQNNPSGMN